MMMYLEFIVVLLGTSNPWKSLTGWLFLVAYGLAYLTNKLMRGRPLAYASRIANEKMKSTLMLIHGGSSFLLSLAIPNNYLNELEFFRLRYQQNELWIAVTMALLVPILFALFGIIISGVVRLLIPVPRDGQKSDSIKG